MTQIRRARFSMVGIDGDADFFVVDCLVFRREGRIEVLAGSFLKREYSSIRRVEDKNTVGHAK